jgi:hypothetical protein
MEASVNVGENDSVEREKLMMHEREGVFTELKLVSR